MAPKRAAGKASVKRKTAAPAAAADGASLLKRIFSTVEAEAAANPGFLERLNAEIAAELGGVAMPTPQAPSKPEPAAPEPDEIDELADLNPIAMVDVDGAEALRDELRFIRRKEPLIGMARRYALDVPQKLLKKQMPVWRMVDAIIDAAERRAREQKLSAG